MNILKMIVRSYRVLMGQWHCNRFHHYDELIRKEQEAALKGEMGDV